MIKRIFSFLLILVFIVLSACGQSNTEANENFVPESTEISTTENEESLLAVFQWEFAEPEEFGVNSSAVEAMFSQMNSSVCSAIVVKSGKTIGEYFANGYNEESVFTLQSVSKSITGTLVGIAVDRGYIKSIDDYAADYLPALAQSEYADMRRITIRHLLSHTSGLVCTENSPQWVDWRSSDDWVGYLISQPMSSSPGSRFEYSTGNTHVLSAVLEAASGMPLLDFVYEVLFDPIGISSATLEVNPSIINRTERSSYDITSFYTDPAGIGDGGNGFSMTAYDLARIGLLYLQDGNWMGQQVVSSEYINAATTTQAVRESDGSEYGFCWWTNRGFGNAHYTGYFTQGHFGQFIFVVPEIELVVVFTSIREHYSARQYRNYVNILINSM